MIKRLFVFLGVVFFVAHLFATIAAAEPQSTEKINEKPITLKGLSVGMDMNAARKICKDLLRKNWIVSHVDTLDELLDEYMIGFRRNSLPIVGKRGFLIKNKNCYSAGYGFISDDGNGKVAQIIFSGELTDYVFSTKEVHADIFVEDFVKNFGLPDLPWILHGWQYASPYGYELTIMIDKSIDLKKNDPSKQSKSSKSSKPGKPKIKFD